MDAAERENERRQLYQRLQSGAISQADYEGLLAALELRDPASSALQSFGANPTRNVADDTAGAAGPSIGEWKTVSTGLSVGTEIGSFRIQEAIGEGGMGMVWKAHDTQGERFVALKLLPPALAASAEEIGRVKEVFQRVHALNHQYICPVYLLGTDPRFGPYLVMKYIDGATLSRYRRHYLKRMGSFPILEAARLLMPVAEALDYAHGQKVIHRDIKPQNILVTRDGKEVQVVDFGLAAEIRSSMTRVSRIKMDTSGTYPYMAPEQWRGQYQDGKTDQYQLAVVAYELLSGHLPFEAPDNDVLRTCVLQEPVAVLPDQPASVNAALARALAKDRAERFADCRTFVKALDPSTVLEANTAGDSSLLLLAPLLLPTPPAPVQPVLEAVLVPQAPPAQVPIRQSSESRRPPPYEPVPAARTRSRRPEPPYYEERRPRYDRPPPRKSGCCSILVIFAVVFVGGAILIGIGGGAVYLMTIANSGRTTARSGTSAASKVVGTWRSMHFEGKSEFQRDVLLKADGSYTIDQGWEGKTSQVDAGTYSYEEPSGVGYLTLRSARAPNPCRIRIDWFSADQISGTLQVPYDKFYGDATFTWSRVKASSGTNPPVQENGGAKPEKREEKNEKRDEMKKP